MGQRTPIKDLQPRQYVDCVLAIQNAQLGRTKNGKPYLKCLLADRTGRTPGRMWNMSEELFAQLPTNGFVFVAGHTQPYEGQMQIIIEQIQRVEPDDADLHELLPSTENDVDEMFKELTELLATIEHPALAALAKLYLDDEPLMVQFKQAPAARTVHHAYIGGLLEHTLSLMRLGQVICPMYPTLNRDLVMIGLFLHDLGKCSELTWKQGFNRTDDGQLVGHIARGVIWLQRKADDCAAMGQKIAKPLLTVLHHIILSHHGQPEFGAVVRPATPEAIAVGLIDNLDAKLNIAVQAADRDPSEAKSSSADLHGDFTERIFALETRLYRPDPTKLEDES